MLLGMGVILVCRVEVLHEKLSVINVEAYLRIDHCVLCFIALGRLRKSLAAYDIHSWTIVQQI